VFARVDPQTRKFLADEAGLRDIEITEGDEEVARVASFTFEDLSDAEPMPHGVYCSRVFKRRAANLHLRVIKDDRTFLVTIPNPVKAAFADWQPRPLPQTCRVGEVDIVLQSLTCSVPEDPDGFKEGQVVAKFEAFYQGRKVEGVEFSDDLDLADATGNVGDEACPPLFAESAWKVRKSFRRTDAFPFSETEGIICASVPMPAPGKYQILPLREEDMKGRFRTAAVVGRGHYLWRGGTFVESGEVLSEEELTAMLAREKEDVLILNALEPCVVLMRASSWLRRWDGWAEGDDPGEKLVRGRWGGQGHWLRRESDMAIRANFGGWPEVISFSLTEDKEASPQPGTPISVQIVSQKEEVAEFFVAPPKLYSPPQSVDPEKGPPLSPGTPITVQVMPVRQEIHEFFVAPPLVPAEPAISSEK
jgi:hypothetical protein